MVGPGLGRDGESVFYSGDRVSVWEDESQMIEGGQWVGDAV